MPRLRARQRKKNQSKIAKRSRAVSDSPSGAPRLAAIVPLAQSIWRMHRRSFGGGGTEWVKPGLQRLVDQLEEVGISFLDRTGQPYVDGETLEVVARDGPADWGGPLVITEVISPAVLIDQKLCNGGKVVIGPPNSSSEDRNNAR